MTGINQGALKPSTLIWFFALAFIVLFAGYGLRDPWPADEPRFVLVAKQMVESGNWLFPHRGIELYPDKPPVFFWLLSLSYYLIGSWRWSFLLPSLLAGMLTLWLTFDLGKRLWTPRTGLWAAIAVLVSVQFVYQFKRAQIDPVLVAMTTTAFYCIARHVLLGQNWKLLYTGFFLAGLGVITKGVGFLPLFSLLPLILFRRMGFQPLSATQAGDAKRWLLAILVFLAAIALWLVPVVYIGLTSDNPEHRQYLENILFKQTAERYANPWHHYEPFWYFAEIIGLFWLPFSLSFFWLVKLWREAINARDLRVCLPLFWGIMVVIFFSISSGKRDMYILPALPAFALAAAPFLQQISERVTFRRCLLTFVLVLGLLLFGLGLFAYLGKAAFAQKIIVERGLGSEVQWLWWMLIASGAIVLAAGLWARTRRILHATAISLLVLWLGYGYVVHPVLDSSSSSRDLMRRTYAQAGPDVEIGLVAWKEQNLLQAQGKVIEFGFLQPETAQLAYGIQWLQRSPQSRRLLISERADFACVQFSAPNAVDLEKANRKAWWLVNADAVSGCDVNTLLRQSITP
jgi:4-amino-4-deoxy-L-arabinose transferase-like glycosyltransferase